MMAVIYWGYNKRIGTYLAFNIFSVGVCTNFLKIFLHVPRPWMLYPEIHPTIEALSGAGGFSCPSGHTSSATAFFGSLAIVFRKPIFVPVLCVLMIAAIGFSRMYLGVHTPLDVLLGLVLAGLLLWLNGHLLKFIDQNPQKDWVVVFVSIGITFLLITSALVLPYPTIEGIGQNVLIDAFTGLFLSIGWFCGFLIGWLLERRKICFLIPLETTPRILRCLCGLLFLLVFQTGLSTCLPPLLGVQIGQLLSGILLGLFISAGYPYLFHFVWEKSRNK
jgi:hypothetical protein